MDKDYCKEVGKIIRTFRKQNNLTQAELGKRLNLSSQAIANYENGKRAISTRLLLEICKKLNLPIEYFFDNSNDYRNGPPVNSMLVPLHLSDEMLDKDFEVVIIGDASEKVRKEIQDYVAFIKNKYGYPKK